VVWPEMVSNGAIAKLSLEASCRKKEKLIGIWGQTSLYMGSDVEKSPRLKRNSDQLKVLFMVFMARFGLAPLSHI
jgi:hypothetical protein